MTFVQLNKQLLGMVHLRKRLQNRFVALLVESKCYVIGILILALSGIMAVFQRSEAAIFTQIGAFIFALGLLPPIENLYTRAWRKLLGKLAIVTLIALTTNLATGFGRQMVSVIVGASPEPFTATVHIATILFSPILFLLTLAVGGMFIFFIATPVGTIVLILHGLRKRIIIWICRFAALSIAAFGSWNLLNRSASYSGKGVSPCILTFCDPSHSESTLLNSERLLCWRIRRICCLGQAGKIDDRGQPGSGSARDIWCF